MATLDFAFLAEFAKVEAGATITAVGAGLRGVMAPAGTSDFMIFVAGGVDRARGEGAATLTATVESPDGSFKISQSAGLEPAPAVGDFATTVFALGIIVPVLGPGKYGVKVALNDEEVDHLELWIAVAATDDPSVPTAGD